MTKYIGRPRSVSSIRLITSMITDRIGRHEVLLQLIISITKLEKKWRKRSEEGNDNSFNCEIRKKKGLIQLIH